MGHDLTDSEQSNAFLQRVKEKYYDFVYFAPPCTTLSIRASYCRRSKSEPLGTALGIERDREKLLDHYALFDFTVAAIDVLDSLNIPWMVETCTDRGVSSAAYWPDQQCRRSATTQLARCYSRHGDGVGMANRSRGRCSLVRRSLRPNGVRPRVRSMSRDHCSIQRARAWRRGR